ncbi:MAG: hypothetical protein AABY40_02965 [Nanoarchaeota archaeon]
MKAVENVVYKGKLLAVIIRAKALDELQASGKKMSFHTPEHFPLQVGIHSRQKGDAVSAHFHRHFPELKNLPVQEFFYVKSGKVKIDLFDEQEDDAKVSEVVAGSGDTVLLNTGHGMTFLEKTELIELKQGPYRGREEEKRFIGIEAKR